MRKFKKVAAGVPGFKANLPKFNSWPSFLDFVKDPKNDIRIKGKKANIDNLEQVVNDLGFDMLQGSAEKGVGIKELAEKLRYIIESRIKK
jgi:hypothetical protein